MTTGEKIKSLRKLLGLTQTELGEKVGVKKNAVSKWECGRVEDIPTSTVKALANLFSVPTSYLIDDDVDNKKAPILTEEDECDVARDLEAFVSKLETGDAVMFDGDPLTPEARDSIISAMRLGLEAAKAANRMKHGK